MGLHQVTGLYGIVSHRGPVPATWLLRLAELEERLVLGLEA